MSSDSGASASSEAEEVRKLVENGNLHELLRKNPSADDVKALIDKHPFAIRARDHDTEFGTDPLLPLHTALKSHSSVEVIKVLLERYEGSAKESLKYGWAHHTLPLHIATRYSCELAVVLTLVNAYPEGVKKQDQWWKLPLHYAIEHRQSDVVAALDVSPKERHQLVENGEIHALLSSNPTIEDVQELLDKHPNKVNKEYNNWGSSSEGLLPLHTALHYCFPVEFIELLLSKNKSAAGKKFSHLWSQNELALYIAINNKDFEVIKAVVDAYPEGVKTKGSDGKLPLYRALENGCGLDIVELLLGKYLDGAKTPNDQGKLPLHVALECERGIDIIESLLEEYPEGAKAVTDDGKLPLHIALIKECEDALVDALLKAYSNAVKTSDQDGKMPLHYAIDNDRSEEVIFALLKNDMPILKGGSSIKHTFSWNICVASDKKGAIGAVRRILAKGEGGFGKYECILALANSRDAEGRSAINLASSQSRAEIFKYLYFCARFKLMDSPPEHCSASSLLLRALDVNCGGTFNNNGLVNEPREVVIKLMQSRDNWKRERDSRIDYNLDPKFVVTALSKIPLETDFEEAVRKKDGGLGMIADKFFKGTKIGHYAIVMDAADRNLHQIYFQEHPGFDTVKNMLKEVFECVNHLHKKNLMHGDLKMLNILRLQTDFKLRLIDLDASTKIARKDDEENSFAGAKFSSAILPPEMIARIRPDQIDDFKAYWEEVKDEACQKKVAPKLYTEEGVAKAHYVVKSFRTKEGKPIGQDELPYKLVRASESIDAWSLGTIAYTLLTGESLIPATRDDDCASGAAMHILYTWEEQPEVLFDRFNKIHDESARHLVMKLLQKNPEERPSVASLLESHPYFRPDLNTHDKRTKINNELEDKMEKLKKKARFCGRYKLHLGPPLYCSPKSLLILAQDLGEQIDYEAIFNKSDKDNNGRLGRDELEAVACEIGLNPDLFVETMFAKNESNEDRPLDQNESKEVSSTTDSGQQENEGTSKENFVTICKQHLGDGPREVVIKFVQSKDQQERELNARKKYRLSPEYVVSALQNTPSKSDVEDAVNGLEGGLESIVNNYQKGSKPGNYAIVMGAADRNLQEIFYQEKPQIDVVKDILKQVFKAVDHIHEKKLMHGDLRMRSFVRFRSDNKIRLINFDASADLKAEESYAGAEFSSAVLPPEMIASIKANKVDDFKSYWSVEDDEGTEKKIAPKIYMEDSEVKAYYAVKSFRTKDGKPVDEGKLPYDLVRASESIDVWSLGVLAFTLFTGESLIPSTRDYDCASGAAMHLLYTWGDQPEVLIEAFDKITDDSARDLVMQLLQKNPRGRPSVASLLANHAFFKNDNNLAQKIDEMKESMKQQEEELKKIAAGIAVIKELGDRSMIELARTRAALMKGIFEANEVTVPPTFIILMKKLPEQPEEQDFIENDGSGLQFQTRFANLKVSKDGVSIEPQQILKDGLDWVEFIKKMGTLVAARNVEDAFKILQDKVNKKFVSGVKAYVYLVDELTGKPVQAPGWPIEIKEPSKHVHKFLPLMQVGMRAMSIYNGTTGLARMFGYPLPEIPDDWSKGARESVELLKKKSSVAEFGAVHEKLKNGKNEETSVRGKSLREFKDFLNKYDPGLSKNKSGDFAGLRRIGDPNQGTALWTKLTDSKEIEDALRDRAKQRREEKLKQDEYRSENEAPANVVEESPDDLDDPDDDEYDDIDENDDNDTCTMCTIL